MEVLTREKFERELYRGCLDELYRASQPSITLEELEEKKESYEDHYLAQEDCNCIIDKYADFYRLESGFNSHCDILIRDMTEGCSKDKYIKPKDGSPGYRSYEDVAPLSKEIGEENLNKVTDFIKMRANFYKFNRAAENFHFNMINFSPSVNKEAVIEKWKEKGVDIVIEDRDPKFNYERYWLGYSEEEIKELEKELKAENE